MTPAILLPHNSYILEKNKELNFLIPVSENIIIIQNVTSWGRGGGATTPTVAPEGDNQFYPG